MAAERAILATIAKAEPEALAEEAAQYVTVPPPWRWWWLAVLGASILAWAPVICGGLLLAGWRL